MAKQLLAKNIPAGEVDDMVAAFKKLGATDVKKTENPDHTFDIEGSFPN